LRASAASNLNIERISAECGMMSGKCTYKIQLEAETNSGQIRTHPEPIT